MFVVVRFMGLKGTAKSRLLGSGIRNSVAAAAHRYPG